MNHEFFNANLEMLYPSRVDSWRLRLGAALAVVQAACAEYPVTAAVMILVLWLEGWPILKAILREFCPSLAYVVNWALWSLHPIISRVPKLIWFVLIIMALEKMLTYYYKHYFGNVVADSLPVINPAHGETTWNSRFRRFTAWLVTRFSTKIDVASFRSEFRKFPIHDQTPDPSNPHGVFAAHRSTGDNFITSFAAANALPVYSVSVSPKDQWHGVRGCRYYYHEKDLRMDAQHDELRPTDLVKLVDVDYYLTPADFAQLLSHSRGLIFYTLQPERLASLSPHFTVSADGTVTESHAGSTPYVHKVWNWKIDYLTTVYASWKKIEIVHSYVEYRKISDGRYVVLVTPVRRGGLIAFLASFLSGGLRFLERWSPVSVNGVNVLNIGDEVVLAQCDTPIEYRLPVKAFYDAVALGEYCQNGSLQRILNDSDVHYHLSALINKVGKTPFKIPHIPLDSRTPNSYRADYMDVHEDDKVKVKGQVVFPALIDDGLVPASSLSNDIACVDNRLVKLQTERKGKVIKAKYYRFVDHFVGMVVPRKHILTPWSVEEVLAAAKTSQREKYIRAMLDCVDLNHKAFQKTEAYPEPKDPRNISAVDPQHVVQLLRFVLPLTHYLKEETNWYYFGLHPTEIAKRLVSLVANGNGTLVEGDFSRFDGTQTTFGVSLNTNLMVALFRSEESDVIRNLKYDLSYSIFKTEHGVRYNTLDSTKSGSADTSVSNTINHAFAQFAHFMDLGFQPNRAYASIGACAGDDGLLFTPSPARYESVCSDLLYKLKCTVRDPQDPVSFLGRIYPGLSQNNGESFFDPYRAFHKLHISANGNRKEDQGVIAARRLGGFIVTDKNNFVGHVAAAIYRLACPLDKMLKMEYKWGIEGLPSVAIDYNTLMALDPVYPCYVSDPLTLQITSGSGKDEVELDPSVEYLAKQIGTTPRNLVTWYQRLCSVKALADIPPIPVPPVRPHLEAQVAVSTTLVPSGVQIGPPPAAAPRASAKIDAVCYSFFRKKTCPRSEGGRKCKFVHDKNKFCVDYVNGKCKRVDCKRPHVALSAQV